MLLDDQPEYKAEAATFPDDGGILGLVEPSYLAVPAGRIIEASIMKADMDAWKGYIDGLGKPVAGIFTAF